MDVNVAFSDQNNSNIKSSSKSSVSSVIFWMKIYIYFWALSVVGQFFEIAWWRTHIDTMIPLAPPYGLGAVAVILFVWPLIRDHKINPSIVFVLSTLLTGFVEYICAVFVVAIYGVNRFWNYSDRFMNINGYVCLESAVLFGLMATFFIYLFYPICENIFSRLPNRYVIVIFWALLLCFIVDSANSGII